MLQYTERLQQSDYAISIIPRMHSKKGEAFLIISIKHHIVFCLAIIRDGLQVGQKKYLTLNFLGVRPKK